MEYHSFLLDYMRARYPITITNKFPSPYGFIFILTEDWDNNQNIDNIEFPSPYGVLFILIIL